MHSDESFNASIQCIHIDTYFIFCWRAHKVGHVDIEFVSEVLGREGHQSFPMKQHVYDM